MGSKARRQPIVTRAYRPGPGHCARAIELLLRKPTNKNEGGPATAPDARKGSSGSGEAIVREKP